MFWAIFFNVYLSVEEHAGKLDHDFIKCMLEFLCFVNG